MTDEDRMLASALRSYTQDDIDGVFVLVSRLACEFGADRIEALSDEVERLLDCLNVRDAAQTSPRNVSNRDGPPPSFARIGKPKE